ncbi:MAG: LPXTG cell wall anchor domain-containing protein [Theionarchaea archaeon]|nr:LPXTG cell wall anchor domain-containing protein [Theionarchaea archaeon]MBU7017663.1 LPXTG cell wall anchor domain-containing protein [Theionarchaea archaeon]MBU7021201.1 LPXTG cell wall anchor domain-containing protein [Theionarchaea archaeon]
MSDDTSEKRTSTIAGLAISATYCLVTGYIHKNTTLLSVGGFAALAAIVLGIWRRRKD